MLNQLLFVNAARHMSGSLFMLCLCLCFKHVNNPGPARLAAMRQKYIRG